MHLVMCPPDHYSVSYRINPWMDPASWTSLAEILTHDANVGWRTLFETYRSLGAEIEIMPAQPSLPDLVFTANCAFVLDRKTLLARYRHRERRGEEPHGQAFFERLKRTGSIDEIHQPPDGIYFEGAGDCLWDPHRRVLWNGWGQRSSKEIKEVIKDIYRRPVVSLELTDPRFYHLDTAFCILSGGDVLYVPGAFTAKGVETIKDLIGEKYLIEVSNADAQALAANSVSIGKDVVFGNCGLELSQELTERGYIVHRVPLGSFARSGGSAYCLTLRLDNMTFDVDI